MIKGMFGRWERKRREKAERMGQNTPKTTLRERVMRWFRPKQLGIRLTPIADCKREVHWLNRKARKLHGARLRIVRERIAVLNARIRATEGA